MKELTPQEIVHELDKHIIGQDAAKRAVAIALRNRWRRSQVEADLRNEIMPKNILMIGPTGPDTVRIRAAIDDCNVRDRVDLVGFVAPVRLAAYYHESDILVMPLADFVRCKYWMSPLKLFEYLNARRPIIASDHTVVREILRHEDNALLVPAENPACVRSFRRSSHPFHSGLYPQRRRNLPNR